MKGTLVKAVPATRAALVAVDAAPEAWDELKEHTGRRARQMKKARKSYTEGRYGQALKDFIDVEGTVRQSTTPLRVAAGALSNPRVQPEALVSILGLLVALRDGYKTAHWLASGPSFYSQHKFFDKLYKGLDESVDQIGEYMAPTSPVAAFALGQKHYAALAKAQFQLQAFFVLEASLQNVLEATLVEASRDPALSDVLSRIAGSRAQAVYFLGQSLAPAARANPRARANKVSRGGYPFARKIDQYRAYSVDQLLFAYQDAHDAMLAMRGHDDEGEGWYADDLYTIRRILADRGVAPQLRAVNPRPR